MAVLNIPIERSGEAWGFEANNQVFESPLDGVQQSANLSGGKWRAALSFSNVVPDRMRRLRAFLMQLKGQSGQFYVSPSNYVPFGNVTAGTQGLVNGAGQNGKSIASDGWTPSTLILAVGDYVEINSELKVITQDCYSDATGAATLVFEPEMVGVTVDNAAIECMAPRCIMRLEDDDQVEWAMSLEEVFNVTLSCREVG